jgi:hypothetical protein
MGLFTPAVLGTQTSKLEKTYLKAENVTNVA